MPPPPDSKTSGLLQGTLDMMILQVVALDPQHGYAIAVRLHQISNDVLQVQQGSLYPALHRLERKGWLSAEWRGSELGRMAKVYSLTSAGEKQLATEAENWRRMSGAISLVMGSAQ
ncbi:MAG: PadR family transcriptional regulator [Acidobacteria bacterium]|nr:PadR family transcriptional regulator [Acidobacteriota bacterium]